jgi:chromosome transmission fidelity protein 1
MEEIIDRSRKIDFHHPFTPYDVQDQFMHTVYSVLEQGNGQVGILESPTGTVRVFCALCLFVR